MTQAWHEQVSSADCTSKVLWCARNYLMTWTAARLARLPVGCRPAWVDNASDVIAWHEKLASESAGAGGRRARNACFEEMSDFFARAAARLAAIDSFPPQPG